jgi:magnesium transporter
LALSLHDQRPNELPVEALVMNNGMPPISCSVYNGSAGQQSLTSLDRISDVLEEPGAFVWLDIVAPKPEDFILIQTEFAMHPLAIEDAIHSHQRPKIEAYGDSWFVVVHAASRNGSALDLHELAIFIGRNFVVTVRALPVYPLDEMERRWHQGSNGLPRDSGALLYTILDTVVDGFCRSSKRSRNRSRRWKQRCCRRVPKPTPS